MPLLLHDKNLIKSLKRVDVEQTLPRIKRFLARESWIGKTNRYCLDTIARIKSEWDGGLREPSHLARYIAASCTLHCADGWGYLGRALVCLLRGDPHGARHLAYYAELRAAMSLLACEGIGIFSTQHFAINSQDNVHPFRSRQGTHVVAWEYLRYWSGLRRSGDLLINIIRPNGRALEEWLAPIGGTSVIAAQARKWFQQWGMDLRALAEDREARNESSYRPESISNVWILNPYDALEFAEELWYALEPTTASLFRNIDLHILRLALESSYEAQSGRQPSSDAARFKEFVGRIVDAQSLDGPTANQLVQFTVRETVPNDLRIFDMSKVSADDQALGSAAIISRATLLLRVSAGSALSLMHAGGISSNEIDFWWQQLGNARGLWDGGRSRDELLDLWKDIDGFLDDAQAFRLQNPRETQTFYRLSTELAHVVVGLGSCERVALWTMNP